MAAAGDTGHPRARPARVLGDTIQPFPSFSGIYDAALMALRMRDRRHAAAGRPMDAQMRSLIVNRRQREPELLGQTVVLIGGSAGIGLETARRARSRGRRRRPHRPQSRAARAGGARSRRAEHRRLRRHRRGRAEAVLRRAARPDRPRAGHGRRPALRAAARDGRGQVREALSDHVVLGARGRAQRRRQDAARRHAAAHGRHRRPADRRGLGIASAATAALPPSRRRSRSSSPRSAST